MANLRPFSRFLFEKSKSPSSFHFESPFFGKQSTRAFNDPQSLKNNPNLDPNPKPVRRVFHPSDKHPGKIIDLHKRESEWSAQLIGDRMMIIKLQKQIERLKLKSREKDLALFTHKGVQGTKSFFAFSAMKIDVLKEAVDLKKEISNKQAQLDKLQAQTPSHSKSYFVPAPKYIPVHITMTKSQFESDIAPHKLFLRRSGPRSNEAVNISFRQQRTNAYIKEQKSKHPLLFDDDEDEEEDFYFEWSLLHILKQLLQAASGQISVSFDPNTVPVPKLSHPNKGISESDFQQALTLCSSFNGIVKILRLAFNNETLQQKQKELDKLITFFDGMDADQRYQFSEKCFQPVVREVASFSFLAVGSFALFLYALYVIL